MGGLFYPIVYESYYGVWVIYNSCITLHSSIEWFRESYAFSIRILFFYSKYQIVNSTRFGGVSSKFPNSRFNQIGSKTNNKEQHWYFWKKFCFFSFTVHDLKLSHFFQKKKTSKKCDNLGTFTQKVPKKEKSVTIWSVTIWSVTIWSVTIWSVTIWSVTIWQHFRV